MDTSNGDAAARMFPINSSRKPPLARKNVPLSSAPGRAACSPPSFSPKWGFARSFWNAAKSCASAPRIPGACGARGVLNPASNVQFGEGGAGTFSDGKLYSQIKDPRHLGRKVLTEFVEAGAPEEILYVAKPHIGTFRLVTMVESIRAKIERAGRRIPIWRPCHRF